MGGNNMDLYVMDLDTYEISKYNVVRSYCHPKDGKQVLECICVSGSYNGWCSNIYYESINTYNSKDNSIITDSLNDIPIVFKKNRETIMNKIYNTVIDMKIHFEDIENN